MMRVISGKLKGAKFETLKGRQTHPMGDRIKVALFNTISAEIGGARILDAYAGSGALGLEALSRGGSFAQFIEKDARAFKILASNVAGMELDSNQVQVTRANCASWVENNQDQQFDIIFVDPPFDQLNLSTIFKLSCLLSGEGLMVLSHSGREAVPIVNGVVVVDNRMYGDAALSYYRKAAE